MKKARFVALNWAFISLVIMLAIYIVATAHGTMPDFFIKNDGEVIMSKIWWLIFPPWLIFSVKHLHGVHKYKPEEFKTFFKDAFWGNNASSFQWKLIIILFLALITMGIVGMFASSLWQIKLNGGLMFFIVPSLYLTGLIISIMVISIITLIVAIIERIIFTARWKEPKANTGL